MRKFPTASTIDAIPSGATHPAISRWHSRMGGDRNVRQMLPESSLNLARVWQGAMTSLAQSVLSRLACPRFTLSGDCELSARLGLANDFCRRPAGQDE